MRLHRRLGTMSTVQYLDLMWSQGAIRFEAMKATLDLLWKFKNAVPRLFRPQVKITDGVIDLRWRAMEYTRPLVLSVGADGNSVNFNMWHGSEYKHGNLASPLHYKYVLNQLSILADSGAAFSKRTSHTCVCQACDRVYIQHEFAWEYLDTNGDPFLHWICDGSLVKL